MSVAANVDNGARRGHSDRLAQAVRRL